MALSLRGMRLGLVALTCTLGVVVAGCADLPSDSSSSSYSNPSSEASPNDEPQSSPRKQNAGREKAAAKPSPTPTPTPKPAPQGPGGLSPTEVSAVHNIALQTGYSFQGIAPRDSALLAVTVCERVASGATSWEAEEREAIASGAPPSAASKWNDYIRDYVC
ncbi:exported hypothetical protein [Nocardioides sp. AX2bis]|nr:exported hypothetical protein [Nocardioides sp. AX2bis]